MEKKSPSGILFALFVALAAVTSVLAVRYRAQKDQLESELGRLLSSRGASGSNEYRLSAEKNGAADNAASDREYELLELLARKDAVIRELRAGRTATMRSPARTGRAPAQPGSGSATEPLVRTLAEQIDFLAALDISDAPPDRQAAHEQLIRRLAALHDRLDLAGTGAAPEDRGISGSDLASEAAVIGAMLQREQETVYYATGRQLGYDEETARWFSDYLTYVNDTTSPDSTMRRIVNGAGAAEGTRQP